MIKYLSHSEEEYRAAAQYARLYLGQLGDTAAERKNIEIFFETANYAALRTANAPLRRVHLLQMHGQPVYFYDYFHGNHVCAIVDAKREQMVMPSYHNGNTYAEDWFTPAHGKYYEFPQKDSGLLK